MTDPVTFTVRNAEPNDYEAFQRIMAGPRVVWETMQLPFASVERWRKALAEPAEGAFNLVACVDSEVVGQIYLGTFPHKPRRRHAGQIGIAVRDDWQGKGAGSTLMQAAVDLADKWLNLSRLELEVYTDNEPAVRLYKKFGFSVEGTLRRYALRAGRFVDAYMMARLRQDEP